MYKMVDGIRVAMSPEEAEEFDAARGLALDDYRAAIEAHVDAVAGERDYGSAVSATSYILPDPNAEGVTAEEQKWDAEGRAVQRWRNAVWKAVFAAMASWQAGGDPPTIEALIDSLPAMEWPEAP